MLKITETIREALKRVIKWVFKDELQYIEAFGAADVCQFQTGYIVVMSHIGKTSMVKVLRIPPQSTLEEWKELIHSAEYIYGLSINHIDSNPAYKDFLRMAYNRR